VTAAPATAVDAGWSYHALYGVVLASNRPIAVLPGGAGGPADLSVRWQDRPIDVGGRPWFRTWERSDGTVIMRAARTGAGGYLLDFDGRATFELTPDATELRCSHPEHIPMETAVTLLVDQVVPLVLAQRRALVFHGSAIDLDGRATAFMGPSGRGKSTLAAHLVARGHRLLADDCVRFDQVDDAGRRSLVVQPAYPGVRLWEDSLRTVAPDAGDVPPVAPGAEKRRYVDPGALPFADTAVPVERVLFLVPAAVDDPRGLRLEPLVGAETIGELVGCQFLLDHTDEASLRASFETAALLGRSAPCSRLHLPRDLDGLARHATELLELLRQTGA
jgi:hypothetical protein